MNAAILPGFPGNDLSDVRKASRKTASPDRYRNIARNIRKVSGHIQQNWDTFSENQKENLEKFAYSLLETPKGIDALQISLIAPFFVVWAKVSGKEADLKACGKAVSELIDCILSKIESENPTYSAMISSTLEEIANPTKIGEAIAPGEESDWLRRLSNSAIS